MSAWHLLPAQGVRDQARFLGSDEDERRLFYVAITRSQKYLHLTTAPTPGNQLYQRPSEFWHDVLESKFVKRRPQDYTKRTRGKPEPRSAIENLGLSFSDIKYFFECPYQFKLRILYGFNPPLDEALGYGKSLHDMLAELHGRAIAGERIKPTMARELVQRHMHVPFAYPTLRSTMQDAAEKVVRDYIRAREADFDKLEFSEKAIEVAIGDGVTVSGRIDLVRRRDTQEIAIVDLKSSEGAQTAALTDAQLHIYALGYRELTGQDADYVERYNLDDQTRVSRSVDDQLIEDVKDRVKSVARALRGNQYPHKPSRDACGRCDFGCICTAKFADTAASSKKAPRVSKRSTR
jgi:DNA helicase-2/ATP-dependent DNA helicase PcrA